MRPILACIVTPLALFACSDSSPNQATAGQDAGSEQDPGSGQDAESGQDAGSGQDAESGTETDLRHTFPPVDIEPGQEITSLCQSWTIGNDQPLYVNSVRALNGGGWHHSNWVFVPETSYPGPDGTWPCSERGFTQVGGGTQGGVFFAQSTQATNEEQRFARGAAIVIPAHARVIGSIHLLNAAAQLKRSAMTFEVHVLERHEVERVLNFLTITNEALVLPPRTRSLQEMTCTFPEPAHFDVHYVLPHYHGLGTSFALHAVGGTRDGATVYDSAGALGEAWGKMLEPPVPLGGATAIRVTCRYDNPRETEVRYGLGDKEMCVFLAFTSSNKEYGGFSVGNAETGVPDPGAVPISRAQCLLLSAAGDSL
jgi:hypothetical protein